MEYVCLWDKVLGFLVRECGLGFLGRVILFCGWLRDAFFLGDSIVWVGREVGFRISLFDYELWFCF